MLAHPHCLDRTVTTNACPRYSNQVVHDRGCRLIEQRTIGYLEIIMNYHSNATTMIGGSTQYAAFSTTYHLSLKAWARCSALFINAYQLHIQRKPLRTFLAAARP